MPSSKARGGAFPSGFDGRSVETRRNDIAKLHEDANSAVNTLGDIGPGAKAAFPTMVGVFENSLKETKVRIARGEGYDYNRAIAILRAIVKIDPECGGLFPRTIREALSSSSSPVSFSSRERLAVEDLEEALQVLKKRNIGHK
jgi:hypothetical protein